MEKGIDAYIKEQFHLPPVDIRTYSPLTLAYIGDGIYDLIIRSIIVGKGNTKASRLHQETSKLVRGHLPQGKKCQISDHGKKCDHDRLPEGNRI